MNENEKKETQTRIHVEPHVFDLENERARVTCDKACQTAVTSFPDIEDDVFFSLLEFIPYKDIDKNAIRILDLPRKQRLQFKLPDSHDSESSNSSFNESERKTVSKKALKQKKFSIDSNDEILTPIPPIITEHDAQTSLTVLPHILEENEIARIFDHEFSQTIFSESKTTQTTLESFDDLMLKIKALNNSNQTDKCKYYVICTSSAGNECTCAHDSNDKNNCVLCGCNPTKLANFFHTPNSDKDAQTFPQTTHTTVAVQTDVTYHSDGTERSSSGGTQLSPEHLLYKSSETNKNSKPSGTFNGAMEHKVISFVSQPEEKSLTPETGSPNFLEQTEMSRIPIPINRNNSNSCPSKSALCQQETAKGGNKNEGDDKKIICRINIKAKSDYKLETGKKSVCLNTEKVKAPEPEAAPKKCACKNKQLSTIKEEPFIPLSEIEPSYTEHYLEELLHSTTGVQTEADTGSYSVDSLPGLPEAQWCEKGTELPWSKFILPTPGTYTIRSSQKKDEASRESIAKPPDTVQPTEQAAEEALPPTDDEAAPAEEPTSDEEIPPEAPEDEEPPEIPVPSDEEGQLPVEEEIIEPTRVSVVESEPPPPPEKEVTAEHKDDCRKPLRLLHESGVAVLYNEPYMDIMMQIFPDPYENCPPRTEIPWQDIILPKMVKIKREVPSKPKSDKDMYSGMFLPAESKATDIDIILKANTPQNVSFPIPVKGGAASQVTVSICSTVSGFMSKPKRNGKDCTLRVHVSSSKLDSDGCKSKKAICPKRSTSMPEVSSKKNILCSKCTGSSHPSKHSASVAVKPSTDSSKMKQTHKRWACKSTTPPSTTHMKSPKQSSCCCRKSSSKGGFRQDTVAAALEVYESEMKPLKIALQQLQDKIRSLNMSNDCCWCGGVSPPHLTSTSFNMDAAPSCERPIGGFPQPPSKYPPPISYTIPIDNYKKSHSTSSSKGCGAACSTEKLKKKSTKKPKSSRRKDDAFTSGAYKCPFTELAHSVSSKSLSDDGTSNDKSKTRYSSCKNKVSGDKQIKCVAKISSTFDGALFNSRRGIRTEPERNLASITTKIFSRNKRQEK